MKEYFILFFYKASLFKEIEGTCNFGLGKKRTIVEKDKHFFDKNRRKNEKYSKIANVKITAQK